MIVFTPVSFKIRAILDIWLVFLLNPNIGFSLSFFFPLKVIYAKESTARCLTWFVHCVVTLLDVISCADLCVMKLRWKRRGEIWPNGGYSDIPERTVGKKKGWPRLMLRACSMQTVTQCWSDSYGPNMVRWTCVTAGVMLTKQLHIGSLKWV